MIPNFQCVPSTPHTLPSVQLTIRPTPSSNPCSIKMCGINPPSKLCICVYDDADADDANDAAAAAGDDDDGDGCAGLGGQRIC